MLRHCPETAGNLPATALCALLVATAAPIALAADLVIHSDRPNSIPFPEQEARFIRLVLLATADGAQPCVDELEVYGPDESHNLALAHNGGRASASSCLTGYPQHAVGHLNDGEYGNAHSWIPATSGPEWAQIELPQACVVSRVVISRDRLRQYGDRIPTRFELRASLDGQQWHLLRQVNATAVSGALGSASVPTVPPAPPPLTVNLEGSPGVPPDLRALREDTLGFPNLALREGARAAASSLLAAGAWLIHQVPHLNDGLLGNAHSWISAGEPSWAEVDLGEVFWVYRVAFGSDSGGEFQDRAAISFSVLTATEYDPDPAAPTWHVAWPQTDGPPVHVRTEFKFAPVKARWVRVAIVASVSGECRIDELEVFGHKDPIPLDKIGPLAVPGQAVVAPCDQDQLKDAFVGEEHAWLKTYGRADLDPSLVPYNGRVKEYPRHVGSDYLPLPPLPEAPVVDGNLNDAAWTWASCGAARVADPNDFDRGPLVTQEVWAGWHGEDLYLGVRADRLLSSHLAVVSSANWEGCGVLALDKGVLVFNTYVPGGPGVPRLERSVPVNGALSADLRCFEVRLPLELFPSCRDVGLRVGLGLGGRHTSPLGQDVTFALSSLAIAPQGPCVGGVFPVRICLAPGAQTTTLTGNVPPLSSPLTLRGGEGVSLNLEAHRGPIGPQLDLEVSETGRPPYHLHLFRYDPLERTLSLMAEMVGRLKTKGLDVAAASADLSRLREQQATLLAAPPDPAAERQALFAARLVKRNLLLRDPDLSPLGSILFVKRHPYHPSHIYTDYTDAPFRPGGGVFVLRIPQAQGRLAPESAEVVRLFDSRGGIARDPVATPDLSRIFFGYRPSADGFYHLMSMGPDGSDLRQLTDGPFHDFYPCPLPDGGLAFITTRCAARVFCFRWTSSVLFRMNPDGSDIRPLSHSSLSEWAPSVMNDGRIIWTRWEYVDKGADFSQTLWAIRPDGSFPELVFGNDIIQPNGYACGREVPGTGEISCTLVSHFGDINGPIALLDPGKGRFNPQAIRSLTPEVPWPGMWPATECFRDPVPVARDYFLCSHAPRDRFGLYLIDRFGNRELLYMDGNISSMAPTLFRPVSPPPALPSALQPGRRDGVFVLTDVYQGLEPTIRRGQVKYLRVVEEVRHDLAANPNFDHADFMKWYASPVDLVSGPYGWPAYTAKASLGIVPVEEDGSAAFQAPAEKVLYFEALDREYNELQRMRSVVQLQPGETRSCIGCHESRHAAPPLHRVQALARPVRPITPPSWGPVPFSYERVVQPVLDAHCVRCHVADRPDGLDLTGVRDAEKVPASYRTLISRGLVHVVDCGFNSGGCEKRDPLTFGTVKSKLWQVLNAGHHQVVLTEDDILRLKTWIDLNCPLWPDYVERSLRP